MGLGIDESRRHLKQSSPPRVGDGKMKPGFLVAWPLVVHLHLDKVLQNKGKELVNKRLMDAL